HAAKYDPEVAPPGEPSPNPRPLCLQDLEERAAREGKSVEEIRARDQELLASHRYPTAECLKAGEVLYAAVGAAALPAPRREHYQACLYCQAVVANSVPDEARVAEMGRLLADVAAGE